MNKKKYLINYRVLVDSTPEGLQHKVRDFALEGWEPNGGMNAVDTLRQEVYRGDQHLRTDIKWKYIQVMVRKEPTYEEMNKPQASGHVKPEFDKTEIIWIYNAIEYYRNLGQEAIADAGFNWGTESKDPDQADGELKELSAKLDTFIK